MRKNFLHILSTLLLLLLLQQGCATIHKAPQTHDAPAVVEKLITTRKSWDGTPLPAYPQGLPEVTLLRITIPAGTRLHTHSHPVINAGILLSGNLTVITTEGKTLHLKAGDPIVEVVNTLHYGINEGNIPAEIVVFYAGVAGTPITVLEAQ
ncbi:MAG: cupin domain-containing protein [Desulfopila sp.]|jgi:quercetin dioxygenase-like cupin family protein|nr:cupin domain-containing protein [Desulfopila sp.]